MMNSRITGRGTSKHPLTLEGIPGMVGFEGLDIDTTGRVHAIVHIAVVSQPDNVLAAKKLAQLDQFRAGRPPNAIDHDIVLDIVPEAE